MIENIVKKPWGHESILSDNDIYTVKQIYVKRGHRLSLQYHEQKIESMTVVSGSAYLEMWDHNGNIFSANFLQPFRPVYIPVYWQHRLSAPTEDCIVVEVSTHNPEDVVRMEDDYGRV